MIITKTFKEDLRMERVKGMEARRINDNWGIPLKFDRTGIPFVWVTKEELSLYREN